MFSEPILSSLLVAKLRGAKLKDLYDFEFKGWYVFVASALIQMFSTIAVKNSWAPAQFIENNYIYIHSLSYMLLFVALLINSNQKSMVWIFVGTLLNYIVIVFNGGKMPVLPVSDTLVMDLGHSLINETTRLVVLADIIPIPPPYPLAKIISIGDVFIMAGAFLFIQEILIKKTSNSKKHI